MIERIENSRNKALLFIESLRCKEGFKYTLNHDIDKFPAGILYGTWATAFLNKLIKGTLWDESEKIFIIEILNKHRLKDGTFFPVGVNRTSKSKEYLRLHCYNYAVGAAMEIDANYDFQSAFMDHYLDADFLARWLDQRSFERPWEESNNIVNVASYLALVNDHGNLKGKERLYQMLEWHNKNQNPATGGFDNFFRSNKNVLQSMAGAVHNFHIHHYLDEKMNYESLINRNVVPFLFGGPLTACLSIDFTELACLTYPYSENKEELESALLYHLNALLKYQNSDGGWFENESKNKPTTANGMKETVASSNSYATWFRLCSIGLISCTLLGVDMENWHFRKTLGMGYVKKINKADLKAISKPTTKYIFKHKLANAPNNLKDFAVKMAVKLLR